jgi:peptidoglycan hydrolase CwlO-like protein
MSENNTMKSETNTAAKEVEVQRLVSRLQNYVRDMDARITTARVEIREKQAAVGQLEQEKWKLESEVDKIAAMVSSANS